VTEILFIRLGSQVKDTIHWLVVSDPNNHEQEIIASGELRGADQLSELTTKAEKRQVKVLVPGCDVLLKSLKAPGKSNHAIRLAVPYMLEDNLAEDVEQLFFAYADLITNVEGHNCFTAIVAHRQMEQWLSWLADANIETKHILPDVLAMPIAESAWSAIALGDNNQEQVIIRQKLWQGFVLDGNAWQLQCRAFAMEQAGNDDDNDQDLSVSIEAYSPLPHSEQLGVTFLPEVLPLALMAEHYQSQLNQFNLLQGPYKRKENRSHLGQQWLWVASIALFALVLTLSQKGVQLWQLNAEQDRVQQSIITTYKQAFPKTKRVRVSTIKSQLNRELASLGSVSNKQGFLAMLAKLQPAFANVPALKPESLKFDGKRQELRIQAQAESYQAFEKFSMALSSVDLTVKVGSQSNQGEQVTGSFSVTNKKSGTNKKNNNKRSNKKSKES
jgi:general secretion pathway protein L